jgi:hypothetical protein
MVVLEASSCHISGDRWMCKCVVWCPKTGQNEWISYHFHNSFQPRHAAYASNWMAANSPLNFVIIFNLSCRVCVKLDRVRSSWSQTEQRKWLANLYIINFFVGISKLWWCDAFPSRWICVVCMYGLGSYGCFDSLVMPHQRISVVILEHVNVPCDCPFQTIGWINANYSGFKHASSCSTWKWRQGKRISSGAYSRATRRATASWPAAYEIRWFAKYTFFVSDNNLNPKRGLNEFHFISLSYSSQFP